MSFLQPMLLAALPLVALPIIIHLINQRRYQTVRWAAMMFLLAANRMTRGYARLRQWLIMAFRMAVIAGLVFAISRPLAGGWLGLAAGNRADTTIIVLDRSPSMQQTGAGGGSSKLETGRRQLVRTLETLGSGHWVLIESATNRPRELESLQALLTARRAPSRPAPRPTFPPCCWRHASTSGEQDGADGDLDLLRPPRERLERRQRPLASRYATASSRSRRRFASTCWPIPARPRTTWPCGSPASAGSRRPKGAELLVSLSLSREGGEEAKESDPRAVRDRRRTVGDDGRDVRAEVRAQGPSDPAGAEPRARLGKSLDSGRLEPRRQRRLVCLRRAGPAPGDRRGRRPAGGAAAAARRGDLTRSGGEMLRRGGRGR